jgi:hypothetical protein
LLGYVFFKGTRWQFKKVKLQDPEEE